MFSNHKNIDSLSPSEFYLWHYIQEHQESIMSLSITQLSEQANVSTATVVRAMKKMVYSGYTDFRHGKLKRNQDTVRYSILSHVDNQIQKVILQNEVELTNTLSNLQVDVIEDAIQLIHEADTIYIFARGLSEAIASEMELKFQLLNKRADFFHDPNIIRQISPSISRHSVVIFISLSGETTELVDAAQQLQKNDVASITLTCNKNGTLARYTDELFLGYQSYNNLFQKYEVYSRLSLQVIARILLDSYVVRIHEADI